MEVSSHTAVGDMCLRTSDPSVCAVVQIRYRIRPDSHLLDSSVHKLRSVVACLVVFVEPVQELSFCQPIWKSAASFLHPVILHATCCAGYPAYAEPFDLSAHSEQCEFLCELSAHSEQCELVFESSAHVEQCEFRFWLLHALCEVRFLSIWNSPRAQKRSAMSCPTHLVTCLHRVMVFCATCLP